MRLPLVLASEEVKRIIAMSPGFKARVLLTIAYGCGLRAGEVVRLRVCDIDGAQKIIRIVQSKGRKDRNVMQPDLGGVGWIEPKVRSWLVKGGRGILARSGRPAR